MKLVIVESPSKAPTLKKYLGSDYEVEACNGHIRDLSTSYKNGLKGLGVYVEEDFKPLYVIASEKKEIVKKLKEMASKSEEVILATDPDREGEAIAWHLAQVLDLDIETTKRLEFHEITRDSIGEAIKNPRTIDMNLVQSQETRRILDRFIGFGLSNIVKKELRSESAGRVQSPTLKLICDREIERNNFVPMDYFTINVELKDENLKTPVVLDYKGTKLDHIKEKSFAEEVFSKIDDVLVVTNIEIKEKSIKSKEPYTTSTLQQDAFNKFKMKPSETQFIAQQLYEGIETKEGLVGLITYMRTDSTKLSNSFINRAKNFIIENYGENYFVGEKNLKNITNAQQAHEAIRPTSNHRTPESLKSVLNEKQYKLYKMIYTRAQGSLMADQIVEVHTITLTSNDVNFKLEDSKVLFDGFTKIDKDKKQKYTLSDINIGDKLEIKQKTLEQEQTKAPERYSEAKVVKLMEEKGIGRPSTYASTINTLISHRYVDSKKGILKPTEIGLLTNKFLTGNFEHITDVEFTAEMERKLDDIQDGIAKRSDTIKEFYDSFEEEKNSFLKQPKLVVEKPAPVTTGEKCPQCGADLVERRSKYGKFVACSNYPECKYIKTEKKEVEYVGRKCPQCGSELVYRNSKKGKFIACSGFPKCRHIESINEETK